MLHKNVINPAAKGGGFAIRAISTLAHIKILSLFVAETLKCGLQQPQTTTGLCFLGRFGWEGLAYMPFK